MTSSYSDQKPRKEWIRFALLLGLLILFAYIFASVEWKSRENGAARMATAIVVRNALHRFFVENRRLPENLSSLYPDYIPANRLGVFFPELEATDNLPGWTLNASRIDQNSGYLYFPLPVADKTQDPTDSRRILLAERPCGCRSQFAVVLQDFSGGLIPRSQLLSALHANPPELPE